jgi:hypothetical protein
MHGLTFRSGTLPSRISHDRQLDSRARSRFAGTGRPSLAFSVRYSGTRFVVTRSGNMRPNAAIIGPPSAA